MCWEEQCWGGGNVGGIGGTDWGLGLRLRRSSLQGPGLKGFVSHGQEFLMFIF